MGSINPHTLFELKIEAPDFGFAKTLEGTAFELGFYDSEIFDEPNHAVWMVQESLRDEWPLPLLAIPIEDFIDECRIIFVEQYGEPIDWEEKVVAHLRQIG